MNNITGRSIEIGEGRSVFVGSNGSGDGMTYIRFINEEQQATRFRISPEAKAALVQLLTQPAAPDPFWVQV